MNIRKMIFFSILLTIITLVGCSNQGYDDAMDNGMNAVDNERLKDALDYFEEDLQEKPNDDQATTAIEQVELLIQSFEKLIEEETSEAISLLEKATNEIQGTETITNKANVILDNTVSMDKQLHKIDDLINNKDFEEALELLEESVENIDGKVYLLPFEKQLTSLKDEVKIGQLFAYIEGYSNNANNNSEICQVTEDDIMCTLMTVDLYYLADIESIELQSADTLEIEMVDDSNLLISNINEDSYDMHGRTFNKTTAEDIDNRLEYQSIADVFNRETYLYILETGIGKHDLFEYGEQALVDDNVEEKSGDEKQSKLDNYSDEEIEYARVWLDYITGPIHPQLSVSFREKGTLMSPIEDDSIVYPEDVTQLRGEYTADGLVTYSSNGDGTINLYDVPTHWHQQSDAEMKEAAENVLKTVTKKEVPAGNDEQVLNILENMIVTK